MDVIQPPHLEPSNERLDVFDDSTDGLIQATGSLNPSVHIPTKKKLTNLLDRNVTNLNSSVHLLYQPSVSVNRALPAEFSFLTFLEFVKIWAIVLLYIAVVLTLVIITLVLILRILDNYSEHLPEFEVDEISRMTFLLRCVT